MRDTEYTRQANDFLERAQATIDIRLIGQMRNQDWKETKLRNAYDITITTPRGTMNLMFWDSIYNTEIYMMSREEYAKKRFKCEYPYLISTDQKKTREELKEKKQEAMPSAYDVLSCVTSYDPGTFEEFCADFGYDEDSKSAERTYIAVMRECKQLQRIFTVKQMEELAEIQ